MPCESPLPFPSQHHCHSCRDINRAFQSLSDLSSVRQHEDTPRPLEETKHPHTAAAAQPQRQEAEPEGVDYSSGSDSDVDKGGREGREGRPAGLQTPAAVGHASGTAAGEPDGGKPPHGLPLKLPFHSLQKQAV